MLSQQRLCQQPTPSPPQVMIWACAMKHTLPHCKEHRKNHQRQTHMICKIKNTASQLLASLIGRDCGARRAVPKHNTCKRIESKTPALGECPGCCCTPCACQALCQHTAHRSASQGCHTGLYARATRESSSSSSSLLLLLLLFPAATAAAAARCRPGLTGALVPRRQCTAGGPLAPAGPAWLHPSTSAGACPPP
jgi:hypothetical protein